MAWPLSQLLQGLLLLQQLFCAAHGQYLPTQTVSYLRDLTRYLSPRESLVGLNSSQTQLRYYMLERDMDAFNNSLPLTPSLSLPDDLLLSVIIRPSKFSGTLLAIRDPSGEVIQFGLAFTLRPFSSRRPDSEDGAQQMVLTFRLWRESPDNVTRLARELHEAKLEGREVGRGQQAATASFQDVRTFKMGESWILFYLHLKSGAARFEFWCPGQRHWSGNPEYKQRLGRRNRRRDFRRRGGGTVSGLEIVPGSTLHLLSDGIGDFFRGDVYRLALVSPAKSHSTRQDLKCRVRLPREIRRSNQAQLVLPETGSGEAEPPFPGDTEGNYWPFTLAQPSSDLGLRPPLPDFNVILTTEPTTTTTTTTTQTTTTTTT
uniref:Dystroglycan n=1 Tax=Macrostomum lignano TaxID=282301 RepID=A0A1I8HCV5_9PLAT